MHPTTAKLLPTNPNDTRVGNLIQQGVVSHLNEQTNITIIGFPHDAGVQRNGGRVGAAKAPDFIRHWLYRMTPPADESGAFTTLLQNTVDLGNIECTGDTAADQQQLGRVVSNILSSYKNAVPIILGGGHETSFGHFLGYVEAGVQTAIVNIDAHTDVRSLKNSKPHSGSPFRQAMEHPSKCCQKYIAAGLNRHCVSAEHVEWIQKQRGETIWREELTEERIASLYKNNQSPTMATFDIDAVDQSYAPGVSAPNANGLTKQQWLYAALHAGRSKSVRSMDIVEMNPKYDNDNHTARLAALTVWTFLCGVAER